jgi:hypothetical protein
LKNDRAAGHAILFNKPVLKKPRAKGSMVDPIPLLVVAGLVLLLVTWPLDVQDVTTSCSAACMSLHAA